MNSQVKNSTNQALKVLLTLARPHAATFIGGMFALAIGSAINLILPDLVRRTLATDRFEWVTSNLATVVFVLSALFIVQGVAFFIRSYLLGLVGQRVYAELRERLFRSVLARDIAFFDRNRASDLAARISSDAALVQEAVSVKLSVIIRYGLQVVFGIILMLFMSWKLTAAIVVSVLILVGVSLLFVSALRAASRRYQDALARFTSFASEAFSGVKIVRVLAAQEQLLKSAAISNSEALLNGERRVLWGAGFSSGASALLNLLLLCVAWYGVTLIIGGVLPLNELAAFVLYGAIVAVSFSFLLGAYGDLMQGLGGLERVVQLIDSGESDDSDVSDEKSIASSNLLTVPQSLGAQVVCHGVSFSYPGRSEQLALQGFSCVLAAGSCTAFVGPSGSGKSSLVQLICKLYNPQSGEITLNGVSLNKLPDSFIRQQIAWVPQEATLFGFTVLENLLLGNPLLLRDEALKILNGWEFLDFVQTLEFGFDTKLGEHGTLLSGGQRQRLAIARAVLRKPALLILDEATSGLDSETEAQVNRVIRQHLPEATVMVISHRLATVKNADTIYVLSEGRVLDSGTHDQLISKPGLYRQYVEMQGL